MGVFHGTRGLGVLHTRLVNESCYTYDELASDPRTTLHLGHRSKTLQQGGPTDCSIVQGSDRKCRTRINSAVKTAKRPRATPLLAGPSCRLAGRRSSGVHYFVFNEDSQHFVVQKKDTAIHSVLSQAALFSFFFWLLPEFGRVP
jgi:hypothetical protein